jgi:hypothetical protein
MAMVATGRTITVMKGTRTVNIQVMSIATKNIITPAFNMMKRTSTSMTTRLINTTHIANTKGIDIMIMENMITGMKGISTRDTTMERSTRRMIILLTTTLATEGMGMTTEVTSMAITDMAGTITARALCR